MTAVTSFRLLAFILVGALFASCSTDDGDEPSCSDECPQTGFFGCASGPDEALVVCADFDDDPCLEWGGAVACDPGESCVDGNCTGGCEDDCPTGGVVACDGDGYRDCGDHDSDICLEWSDLTSCPNGETCSNGACSGTCSDECVEGEMACEGDGFKTCGEFDSDSCRDWSPIEPCADGEMCQDGSCVPSQCLEEGEDCVCGENQCCEGHCCPFFFICVSWSPDEDICF
ncbi:MAG: hypothetical protein JRI68_11455 [Deltaproteobacteria bacterium]|nr:hypothetical protein [Deltaproteobacteria bacterium]